MVLLHHQTKSINIWQSWISMAFPAYETLSVRLVFDAGLHPGYVFYSSLHAYELISVVGGGLMCITSLISDSVCSRVLLLFLEEYSAQSGVRGPSAQQVQNQRLRKQSDLKALWELKFCHFIECSRVTMMDRFDLYLPEGSKPRSAVIFITGGAWVIGYDHCVHQPSVESTIFWLEVSN